MRRGCVFDIHCFDVESRFLLAVLDGHVTVLAFPFSSFLLLLLGEKFSKTTNKKVYCSGAKVL